jgi:hypothetical protein
VESLFVLKLIYVSFVKLTLQRIRRFKILRALLSWSWKQYVPQKY